MILAEYVLLPCIFDTACYKDQDSQSCYVNLKILKDNLLHEQSLIRNLYNGEWLRYVNQIPSKHPNTKYILQEFVKRKSLRLVKGARAHLPICSDDWYNEAFYSHKQELVSGIIASPNTFHNYKSEQIIASIEKLDKKDWWINRRNSVELKRQTGDYIQYLKLILNHANSIMFIDPYFDSYQHDYREFLQVLDQINKLDDPPLIEIHLCHLKNGVTTSQYEQDFRKSLKSFIQSKKLKVDVFIWDYFHDRFIISNLIGIQSGHSFSISDNPNETTTWTRIDRIRRDEIQKEFDQSSKKHKLQHKFTVS